MIEVRYSVIVTASSDEEADAVMRAFVARSRWFPAPTVTVLELSREEVQ